MHSCSHVPMSHGNGIILLCCSQFIFSYVHAGMIFLKAGQGSTSLDVLNPCLNIADYMPSWSR
jgi:hypothetical protein